MIKQPKIKVLVAATLAATTVFVNATARAAADSPAGAAAAEPDSGVGLEEIVVTALKRTTHLQDTPISIVAVPGETLTAMGVTDSSQLGRATPGLVVRESQTAAGNRFVVRNIYSSGEPTTGIYVDEIPIDGTSGTANDGGSAIPNLPLFDLERVEVLRGPQGTLYGASSMAGTVRLITAKPVLDGFAGNIDVKGSTVAHGGSGYDINAMVNVPLVDDVLGARAVGFYADRPGFIDNPTLGLKNVNQTQIAGGRLIVRAKPLDPLTVDVMAALSKSTGGRNSVLTATNTGVFTEPYTAPYLSQEQQRDEYKLFTATAQWDLHFASVTGVVSHAERNLDYNLDISNLYLMLGVPEAVPSTAFAPQQVKTDTQELRISSQNSGSFDWTLGFFHSRRPELIRSTVALSDPGTGLMLQPVTPATLRFDRHINDVLTQSAGFGELSYNITPQLTVTGGARHFQYRREIAAENNIGDGIAGNAAPLDRTAGSESGWLYKANISYHLLPHLMLYAQMADGYRPGGVNQVFDLAPQFRAYEADKLRNYEGGIKSSFLGEKLVFNADVFNINWSNIQVQGTNPQAINAYIANAGDARVRGGEFELTARPLRGLSLQAGATYTQAKLTTDQISGALTAVGRNGDRIPLVPDWTAQAAAEYNTPVADQLSLTIRSDVSYSDSSYTTFPRVANSLRDVLPSLTLVGARVGIENDTQKWGTYLYVTNLFDRYEYTDRFTSALFGLGGWNRATVNTPRTVGIELRKGF